jgi:glycine cleavage system H protein
MRFPKELKYTKDHEWTKTEGNTITIGVTDHAQSALGDIVFCELPQVGRNLKNHETFGVVESIKAVSDLFSPVAGKVIAINSALTDQPSDINQDPYGKAWMIKLEVADAAAATQDLMNADTYAKFVETLK